MSPLTEPTKLTLAKTYVGIDDPDAAAYITAVEAADTAAGQSGGLETATKVAIHSFVKGCKADGIWPAIKASCILAGARTIDGALVPLAGATGPNKFGTAANWNYDRKLGLKGDGSTNYLNSNRNNNTDPQDNNHNSAYITNVGTIGGAVIAGGVSSAGDNYLDLFSSIGGTRHANRNATNQTNGTYSAGFLGTARSSSAQYDFRVPGATGTRITASQTPSSTVVTVFARAAGASSFADHRIAFYSIGESLNLALLDARVSALITAIGVAF